MSMLSEVNWLAALVGAVAFFLLGALWYGPLFGKVWSAGMGLEPSVMASPKQGFAVTFVSAVVLAVAVGAFTAGAASTMDALATTVLLWLGVVATTAAINATWDPRPWSVYGINVGYHLTGMLLIALVAALWPA